MEKIEVFCKFDAMLPVSEVKPHPLNPNRHPEGQLKRLADVIRRNGWRNAIVISRLSGCVIKGHGRLGAAEVGGFDVVPVVYQDYATPADEAADLVADNLIAEESQLDLDAVDSLAREFDLEAERLGQLQGDGTYKDTRWGTDEAKKDADGKAARKIPIMILATEAEAERFDACKANFGAKSDEETFSEILRLFFERGNANG